MAFPAPPETPVPADGERAADSACDGFAGVYDGAGLGERGLPGLSERVRVYVPGGYGGSAERGVCVVYEEVFQAACF